MRATTAVVFPVPGSGLDEEGGIELGHQAGALCLDRRPPHPPRSSTEDAIGLAGGEERTGQLVFAIAAPLLHACRRDLAPLCLTVHPWNEEEVSGSGLDRGGAGEE
jgi:hypothetical protein